LDHYENEKLGETPPSMQNQIAKYQTLQLQNHLNNSKDLQEDQHDIDHDDLDEELAELEILED
jgi:hypothetical protein